KHTTTTAFGKRRRYGKPRGSNARPLAFEPSAECSPTSDPPRAVNAVPPAFDSSRSEGSSVPTADNGDDLTAFERKAALLQQCDDAADAPESGLSDAPDEPHLLSGYRFINVTAVEALIAPLLCPMCYERSLILKETGTGASLQFVVVCGDCGDVVKAAHSPVLGTSRQPELPVRLAVASRSCGINITKLSNFFGAMDAPPPMHLKTHQAISEKLHRAAMDTAGDVMREAAQAVRTKNAACDSSELLDVSVSFDGTWHKRGHTSHFGLGAVIELDSGLVLDFSVQSNYCHACSMGPKDGEARYQEWMQSHKEVCQKNFNGSSNAMEVEAAGVLFSRSKELHKMQYTTVLSDGDSKSFLHVSKLNLYDKGIVKEDCVNHVAKRVFAGIEKIKKTKRGLGGKGKITKVVTKKLTAYYAAALKNNAPNVKKMQKAVFASLLHSFSTDAEPLHIGCPRGEDSWCHYNRHLALVDAGKPSVARAHRPAFSREIAKELVPLYNRLADADLLARCSRMQTQNANESLNALVWKRCPKTEFASLKTVETAAALAVVDFNVGPKGIQRVLEKLSV
ncbi:unnamed protein product, partial [Ixodes persulcatus]